MAGALAVRQASVRVANLQHASASARPTADPRHIRVDEVTVSFWLDGEKRSTNGLATHDRKSFEIELDGIVASVSGSPAAVDAIRLQTVSDLASISTDHLE